jgi:hypothetical protein
MLAGLMRLVCLNGMVASAGTVDEIRVHHKGDIVGRVIEGAYSVVNEFGKVAESVDKFKSIKLLPAEQSAFARSALVAKYGEPETGGFPVTAEHILYPRRQEDRSTDLWSTFNVVQEHLIRGGDRGRAASGRRTRTREVTGISQNVQLNRALWTLADEMAKLKLAA